MKSVLLSAAAMGAVVGWSAQAMANDTSDSIVEARAEVPSAEAVALETSGCESIEREIGGLFALESRTLADASEARAHVLCTPHEVRLRVETSDARSVERLLVVDEGRERARLIALALVELLADASGAEIAPAEDSDDAPEPPPTIVERRASPLGIRVRLSGDISSSPLAVRGGGELGIEIVLADWLRWTIEARSLYGRIDAALTMLELSDVSAASSLAMIARFGILGLGVSAGFRFGSLFVAATPLDDAMYSGGARDDIYGGPFGRALVEWAVASEVTLHLEVEVGGTVRPLIATLSPTNEALLRFDGVWGALAIGATLWP